MKLAVIFSKWSKVFTGIKDKTSMLLYVLSVLVGIITAIYVYFKMSFKYWKARGVPYIEPSIPWGNLKNHGKLSSLKAYLDILYTMKDKRTPFVGGYLFAKPVVVVTTTDFAKTVLIKDFNCFEDRGVYSNERDDPLSAHLFSLDGPKWKVLRAKMTPSFTGGKMKYMFPTIVQVAEKLEGAVETHLKIYSFIELHELMARYLTDVIGTCIFGIECNSLVNPDAEFRKMGRDLFEKPRLKPLLRGLTLAFPDTARLFGIKVTQDFITDFFMNIVRETMDYRERHGIRRNDFMDILINWKNSDSLQDDEKNKIDKLSFEEIVAQAFLFFLAGFETSAATMSFVLYELMVNANIQDAVRKEIEDVIQRHGDMSYEALNDMKYLDQVINETLRKYPPVIFLIRKATVDYKVPGTNKVIDKGTSVFVPVDCIQHDPEIYPEPDVFNPERFASKTKINSDAFLPFGDGPRNCIGLRFGLLQVKIGIVKILRLYKLTKCNGSVIPLEFSKFTPVLTPKGGIWVGVERI